ncbi:hypothetical protein FQR65_LT08010 [Abscondita terminalis]|nr:hypothetical protein FQR65_LT08010 [Abscondita terminalis]
MALCLRKDIKKSSYYVWFLGAKESKDLRGSDYLPSVIQHLVDREKDVEPFKVTLQISHKGLKIIQNIVTQGSKNSKPKNETIKHFISHNKITCVHQQDDIIACILLLFNPVTKCPLHVHAYRCDSLETATLLKQQLQTLIERPENQKKRCEIENRLKTPKEVKKIESSLSSDTGTSTRESESSEERFSSDRVTTPYDSVAAELRAKLKKNNEPILLPPRDYDTVHRQKGNLTGIELRRCLNASIVGQNAKNGRKIDSNAGSSGIGSDLPPSRESPDAPETRFNTIDNQSTSDEEWNTELTESTLYLMHPTPYQKSESKTPKHYPRHEDKQKFLYNEKPPSKSLERQKFVEDRRLKDRYDDWNDRDRRYSREKFIENFAYEEENGFYDGECREAPRSDWERKMPSIERYSRSTEYLVEDRKRVNLRQRSPSPTDNETPRERFKDAKEKFLLLEKERLDERKEAPISPTHDKPEPAPRSLQHERYQKESSAERYRGDKYDPKRRSMFCLLEEEHKKNLTEIARELKHRSYMENHNYEDDFYRNKDAYHPELDQEDMKYLRAQKSKNSAGYRHSYAEPKLKLEKSKKVFPDMLQRTNSSVSNSGRVGLASIHPY